MDKKKVLVIEDDISLQELYKIALSGAGFHVLTAGDGQAGLQLAIDNPDAFLVLLDIMLPIMHGVDVLKHLKENETTKNLKVVMLTNLGEETIIKQVLEMGAWEYLLKMKFTPGDLIDYVSHVAKDPHYKLTT